MGITHAINLLCDRYFEDLDKTPEQINCGNCGCFADDLESFGFGVAVWGDSLGYSCWTPGIENHNEDWFTHIAPGHCFIMYEGKFYDSECSEGCEYADQLPFYQRQIWIENTGRRLAESTI